jgi:adenine deaminase
MQVSIKANLVDILNKTTYPAEVGVQEGKIQSITPLDAQSSNIDHFILPGFIDSHVHIESSMLVPSQFARLAVTHGTVATISDPHEIANVCGIEGVEFMIADGKRVPFHFYFGAPSCVPATSFETAGAVVDTADVEKLLRRPEVKYLSEMMNFPGVLHEYKDVMEKIAAARKEGKPVDGHAPGLRGEAVRKYIAAGITTDHECFTEEEAAEKLKHGMKILIREGSAAKNFEALIPLLHDHWENMMFCSDDMHPDSLVEGHINLLCARAVKKGIDVYKVLQAACINPIHHYNLECGMLRVGDAADFIIVKDLVNFEVILTYISGKVVTENGRSFIEALPAAVINNFNCKEKSIQHFEVAWNGAEVISVIEALGGQLITNKVYLKPKVKEQTIVSDIENDILKIVVVNRYNDAPVAKAFIKNFGLKRGAIASSVAHDSHNIVAVGADDESLCRAVNALIKYKGGVVCVDGAEEKLLPLPVGGLMSTEDGYKVAEQYAAIDAAAKELGSTLSAPFMTLSFMALLVIPHIKLSDKGLFDGDAFSFIN